MKWIGPVLGLALAACQAPAPDALRTARNALTRNDLVGALLAYESVPPDHPRFAEVQAAARVVEERLLRSNRLLAEGLEYRTRGQLAESVALLEQARRAWLRLPGGEAVASDVRPRAAAPAASPAPRTAAPAAPLAEAVPAPRAEVAVEAGPRAVVRPEPVAVEPAHIEPAAPLQAVEAPPSAVAAAPVVPRREDAVPDPAGLGLVAVEMMLGRGQLEQSVADVLDLARQFPGDARVRIRLSRVLHQRALLRYGQGDVAGAIADWGRLLEIDPDNELAKKLLDTAVTEARPSTARR